MAWADLRALSARGPEVQIPTLRFFLNPTSHLHRPPLTPLTKHLNPLTMKFTTAFAALLSASTAVFAAPVGFVARDVWVPQILDPTEQSVWQAGGTFDVTWDLSQQPQSVTNPVGTVYLSADGILDIGA